MKVTIKKNEVRGYVQALAEADKWLKEQKPKLHEGGKVIYNLARNSKTFQQLFEDLEETRTKLVEQNLEAQKKDNPEAAQLEGRHLEQFRKAYEPLLKETEEVDIRPILWSQLNLDENPSNFSWIMILLDTVIYEEDPLENSKEPKEATAREKN